ncbi:BQ5605_C032g11093 [Microbotryum silenes-dioicae]|uniref:BQ5605_C032g11056 protein n=1 Tax=Microbotryum silenes-dioicae TaxID=796604 RepID=A0A2X0PBR8_9BASI|nr:BQ5605_C032g11056 [Microbotryum silenes-dioicae]SGZ04843.1 BQ5605_C032g11093 [Microbotryum silenes-dioicae]
MNMTIAELLAFDVAPADASLHIELSKDELTHYSTLSSTRGPTSSCSTQGRPMESSDPSRGEAGVGVSNTEEGRSTAHSCVLKGSLNEIQKNAYIEDGRIQEKLPERDKQYGALAQRCPHFGSLDGACGMHSLSCDQTVYGEEALSIGIGTRQSDNKPLQPRHARLVGSTLKCPRAHMPSKDLPPFGACPACEMPPAEPLQAVQMPPRKQGAQFQQKGSLTTKHHAQHQPKRRAPQATFDRPPRARKRSERVFEDF